jgi:hypothetical protein
MCGRTRKILNLANTKKEIIETVVLRYRTELHHIMNQKRMTRMSALKMCNVFGVATGWELEI